MSNNVCDTKRELPVTMAKIADWFEDFIYSSRWLLLLVNVGLVAALVVYLGRFVIDDYNVLVEGIHATTEDVRVLLLGLVDTALVANLMVMIIQGSHQIFIRRFRVCAQDRPQWLDHIDSGILKVKVALSIAGITLIQILKDFVHLEDIKWEDVVHHMEVHAMCLASALVMAIIWKVMHSNGSSHADSTAALPATTEAARAAGHGAASAAPVADATPGHH